MMVRIHHPEPSVPSFSRAPGVAPRNRLPGGFLFPGAGSPEVAGSDRRGRGWRIPSRIGSSVPLVVAVDVGTSSCRALLYRGGAARPLRHVRSAYAGGDARGAPGDACGVDVYLGAVRTVLDGIEADLEAHGRRADAVALSVFWHSVYVAVPGGASSALYLWNAADVRFARSAARLRSRVDPERVRLAVGAPVHPSFPAGKALALLEAFPDGAHPWLQGLEAALALELFGTREIHVSMASATGLYDLGRQRWDPEVLEALGIAATQLPAVLDGPEDVRALGPAAGGRWPRLAGARWHLPRGDGALSHLGLGATGPERWALTVGTSAALRSMGPVAPPNTAPAVAGRGAVLPPDFPRALFQYRLDDRRAVTGGALSAGGNLLAWVRAHWPSAGEHATVPEGEPGDREVEGEMEGPLVLPHLWGERSPDWPDRAWGGVLALRDTTPGAEVERAAMRSIAAVLGAVSDALGAWERGEGGTGPEVIRAGGRAVTASSALRQMIADATGAPVECPEGADEASARGALALALEGLGVPMPAIRIRTRCEPDPDAQDAYRRLWERIRSLGGEGRGDGSRPGSDGGRPLPRPRPGEGG